MTRPDPFLTLVVMTLAGASPAFAQAPGNVNNPTAIEHWRASRSSCGVDLNWTPGDNYDGVVIIRTVGAAPDTLPTDGLLIEIGTTLGNGTVVYSDYGVGSTPPVRFRDNALPGSLGDVIHYKIHAHNSARMYASGSVPSSQGVKVVRTCAGDSDDWQYVLGTASLAAPAVRTGENGGPYAPSSSGQVTSLRATYAAERFRPVDLGAKVANRFAVLGIGDGTVMRAYAGAQDGYAHCLDADTGEIVWSANLATQVGDQITASPNIQVRSRSNAEFQAAHAGDLAIFATRYLSTTGNRVVALDAASGGPARWVYQPGDLDIITAQPVLSTATNRLFIASFSKDGTQRSVRAINTINGAEVWRSTVQNDIEVSPSLYNGKLVVGTRNGHLIALNQDTGATVWDLDLSLPVATFGNTIFRPSGGRILFTTQQGGIHLVQDNDTCATEVWRRALLGTSSVVNAGLEIAWVGASDGKLHEFSLADGTDVATVPLGEPGSSVGSPAIDSVLRRLYVGTMGGAMFALRFPLHRWAICSHIAETCDGFDNDCDGVADNGFACVRGRVDECTTQCGSKGASICSATCAQGTCLPLGEDCNGVDDDCDGQTDEGFQCAGTQTRSCTDSMGRSGTQTCTAATCTYGQCAVCGDGVVASTEQCDDGNAVGNDGCTACLRDYCGDGVINNGGREQCDDGNTLYNDGCDANCRQYGPTHTGQRDPVLKVPACPNPGTSCTANMISKSTGETNAPNTLGGTCIDGTATALPTTVESIKVATADGTTMTFGKNAVITVQIKVVATQSNRLDIYHTTTPDAPSWSLLATLTPSAIGLQTLTTNLVLPAAPLQALRAQNRTVADTGPCVSDMTGDRDDLVFAVAATDAPPTVTMNWPSGTVTTSSPLRLTATVLDDVKITNVTFYAGTMPQCSVSGGRWVYKAWYTCVARLVSVPAGTVMITARATDSAGQVRVSAPVALTIVNPAPNPPQCGMSYPVNYARISGIYNLQANALAGTYPPISRVDFYVDDVIVGSSTTEPYVVPWDTTTVPVGFHEFSAIAVDSAGYHTESEYGLAEVIR